MTPGIRGLLASIALFTAAAPAAAAGPAWLPAHDVSPATGDAAAPSGGLDAAGAAVVVWQQSLGGGRASVMASAHGADGWSQPAAISAPGDGDTETPPPTALDPRAAVGADGTAVAVWRYRDGGGSVVEGNVWAPGRGWLGPQVLSRAARRFDTPTVAVDAAGNAVVLWVREGQSGMSIQSVRRPAGGVWGPPITISAPGATEAAAPVVSVTDGAALAAWAWRGGPGNLWRVQTARGTAAGAWSAPADVSGTAQDPQTPDARSTADGSTVVWDQTAVGGPIVQAASAGADGVWGTPVTVSEPDTPASQPRLAATTGGTLVLVAAEGAAGAPHGRVLVRLRAPGAGWGAAGHLGPVDELAMAPRVTALPGDGAAVAWNGCPAAAACAARLARLGSGGWSEDALGGVAMSADVVSASASGEVLLVGTRVQDVVPSSVVTTRVFDAAGPDLGSLAVPGDGVVNGPVNMSVVGRDAWAGNTGAASWDFGDGTTGTGAQVAHTYTAPGQYTVSVTQSDGLGNVTTAQRVIRVAPQTGPISVPVTLPVTLSSSLAARASAVRAVCLRTAAGTCRVAVSFRLSRAGRVRVRVALRGRRGAVTLTVSGRAGTNTVRLPARIAGVPLRVGTALAVTVRPA